MTRRNAEAAAALTAVFTHEDILMLLHLVQDLDTAEQIDHVKRMDEDQFERIHAGFHTLQDQGIDAYHGMDVIRGMFCARNLGLLN